MANVLRGRPLSTCYLTIEASEHDLFFFFFVRPFETRFRTYSSFFFRAFSHPLSHHGDLGDYVPGDGKMHGEVQRMWGH